MDIWASRPLLSRPDLPADPQRRHRGHPPDSSRAWAAASSPCAPSHRPSPSPRPPSITGAYDLLRAEGLVVTGAK